jgi:PIN domain nuclease of toxin-antitoxin system
MIHLDTHVLVWLYAREVGALEPVLPRLEREALAISPMVLLEMQYLYEVGRTTEPARTVFEGLSERLDLRLAEAAFPSIVQHALALSWTRDPFDRLIVATALADDVPLLTRDAVIRAHCPLAVWD